MTRATRRPSAARLAIQLAILATVGSAISGGCSSGARTVPGDCGGTGALGGADTVNGGASSGASAGTLGVAADAGQGQGQAGAEVGEGGEGGGAATSPQGGESGDSTGSVDGHAGAGTAGHGGSASSGGMSSTGGHGGSGGHGGNAGNTGSAGSSSGGQANAKCGDKITTSPEFCDDGTNTDLSYGCYACTTLPPPTGGASQGGAASVPEQCDKCLQDDSKPTSCYGCVDYRACYACLRRQPDDPRFPGNSLCTIHDTDDSPDDIDTPQSYSDRCFNPNNSEYQSATGGPAGSEARGLVCQALVACVLRSGCLTGKSAAGGQKTMFTDCYCGVVPTGSSCTAPTFIPNGPCVNEMRDADAPGPTTIGPALAQDIGNNVGDPSPAGPIVHWSALGVANQIATCAADPLGCADVCFPSSSHAGGAGGTAGTAGVGGNSGHGGS